MGRAAAGLPTVFSAVAVGLSCIRVYMSTLQSAKLEGHVRCRHPLRARRRGDTELFAIPLTIANDGRTQRRVRCPSARGGQNLK
jgi:hypothetical protein